MKREVPRARVRAAARWASFAAVVALSAVGTLLLVRSPRMTYLRIDRYPFPIAMPAAERSEPTARAMVPRRIGCSLPVSQIGLADAKDLETNAPRDLAGVAASATGCTIAVWSSHDVLVSRDDGATFTRIASRAKDDRSAPTALAAAVGIDETVYVIRAGRLEIELRDGTLLDRGLPGPAFDRIQVSGRWLVVWSRDQLAVSDDAGATWQVKPTPAVMAGTAVFIDETGTLHVAATTAKDAPLTYYLADAAGGGWRVVWTSPPHRAWSDPHNPWNGDPYHSSIDAFAFGSNGKLYAQRYDAYGYQVFAVSAAGATTTSDKLDEPSVLRGASIAGSFGSWGARDAHGLLLTALFGRGPVRVAENLDRLMDVVWAYDQRGRWLVGGVVP